MFSQSATPDYYDAILMDIRMPVLDGHAAAQNRFARWPKS
jgi:CheY-like chemotaxis protein